MLTVFYHIGIATITFSSFQIEMPVLINFNTIFPCSILAFPCLVKWQQSEEFKMCVIYFDVMPQHRCHSLCLPTVSYCVYHSQGDGQSFPLRWQMSPRSPSVMNGNGHCAMEGSVGNTHILNQIS